jgi:3-methyladenine DNA glycosylase AlkC
VTAAKTLDNSRDATPARTLQHLIPASAALLLGEQLAAAGAGLRPAAFVRSVGEGFEQLGLMARGQRLADALACHLPPRFVEAAALLVASMGRPMGLDAKGEPVARGDVPSGFFYLPHSLYLGAHGLDDLPQAMAAQHALTQRFTAEFSLRSYLQAHTAATLAHLVNWSVDASAHVRRAVSEATRPRLPWAARLNGFVRDPSPVLPLLKALRDDPSAYVRRSVANHLNDMGKDHPERLCDLAREWLQDQPQPATRQPLLRHALRTAIKRGDVQALALFGHGEASVLVPLRSAMQPRSPRIGEQMVLSCDLFNPTRSSATALADWRVHYPRSDGTTSLKVFKGSTLTLAPGERTVLHKTLSLRQMSTRTHHPGLHRVEIALNGQAYPLGHFELHATDV